MSSGMTASEQLKQCHTTREAFELLADHIDNLYKMLEDRPSANPFDAPLDWEGEGSKPAHRTDDGRSKIINGDVVVAPVSAEREDAREAAARGYRLAEFTPLDEEAFVAAYRKGGPRWLYYTNREAVMSMPVAYRQALVADVLLDSPSEADEIGRDILKFDFEEGARETEQLDFMRTAPELGPLG